MQLQERRLRNRQGENHSFKYRQLKDCQLKDLVSIGPAMLRDFELLGIRSVQQLARQNPVKLYQKLCRITGQHIDICCQDVFFAAVAQARNPLLPAEQCRWWYWSRQRKARDARG
jgi:nucleotidyltransferase/DNA polymerase involved in DNA repair